MNRRDFEAKILHMIADHPLRTVGGAFLLGGAVVLVIGLIV